LLSASANAYHRASPSPFRDAASSVESFFAPRASSSPDRAPFAPRARDRASSRFKSHLQRRRRIARRRASFRARVAGRPGTATEFVREFDAPRDRRRRHRRGRWRARVAVCVVELSRFEFERPW